MKSGRLAAAAGAIAIVGLGALTAACGSDSTESPSTTTTTTTTTAPSVTPTEKVLNPTGGNKFSPTVKAPPPATAIPGYHDRYR